jgi:hypothetical protein
VRPMAFVRCPQGGKTRALIEIVHEIVGNKKFHTKAVYITFEDYSAFNEEDDKNPLQALCQRIVFAATTSLEDFMDPRKAYKTFRGKKYVVDPSELVEWLGTARIVLVVDDLHRALREENSEKAAQLCMFIKDNFLAAAGRYFIFSSLTADTLESFCQYADFYDDNKRGLLVKELPRMKGFSQAELLDPQLHATEPAVYVNLIPGLIRFRRRQHGMCTVYPCYMYAIEAYNKEATLGNTDEMFRLLVRSFVSGDIENVPKLMHMLF